MNTIRFIIISLTATVAAVSCTKNEMEGYGYGDGRIGFIGNPGDAFTRGMPVESVADIPDMGVFAYYTTAAPGPTTIRPTGLRPRMRISAFSPIRPTLPLLTG